MRNHPTLAVRAVTLALAMACFSANAAPSISMATRATLQAVMQSFIDRSSVDGRYLRLDQRTGAVEALRPLSAHPTILRVHERYFVLCADFRATSGKKVNVDFYLAPQASSFTVFAQQVDNHALLERMLDDGRAQRVD